MGAPVLIQRLTTYAAAAATCADRYAQAFYPMIKNADEKMLCCVYGGQDMEHHLQAAEVLRGLGVSLEGMVVRPIAERGLVAADALEVTVWEGRAMFSTLFERALVICLEALAASDHPGIAKMAAAAVVRERLHAAHGLTLVEEACRSPQGREHAQRALDRLWPAALGVLLGAAEHAALRAALGTELSRLELTMPGPATR
jgi:1,2-phenylacetyl-CoA epoxidase catalytic subunit